MDIKTVPVQCTRRIEFDAGHRVIGHKNKCQYLHGHRYALEITAEAEDLDQLGMVVDFWHLKTVVKGWIDENFDHTLILNDQDKTFGDVISSSTGQKIYYLKQNPTVENIALHLKMNIIPQLFTEGLFKIVKIKLFETPNCFVEV